MNVAITGANGFVGRNLIALLLADTSPSDIRAIVRDRVRAAAELPSAGLDVRTADVTDPASLRGAFDGIDAVVHTVAIPTERGDTFQRVNVEGTQAVVREAERAGVTKLVHMGALRGAPESRYPYLRSKGLGGGTARFQPLHVADLALVLRAALRGPLTGTYELGGPEPVTYRQLVEETMRGYGIRRPTMPLPVPLMKPAAFLFERTMADPPVTVGQLDLLAVDNTPHPNAIDQVFGIRPRPFLGGGLSYLGLRS